MFNKIFHKKSLSAKINNIPMESLMEDYYESIEAKASALRENYYK